MPRLREFAPEVPVTFVPVKQVVTEWRRCWCRGCASSRLRSSVCLLCWYKVQTLTQKALQLIMISAGFDGHFEDIKGNNGFSHLVEEDYEWVTEQLCNVAEERYEVY